MSAIFRYIYFFNSKGLHFLSNLLVGSIYNQNENYQETIILDRWGWIESKNIYIKDLQCSKAYVTMSHNQYYLWTKFRNPITQLSFEQNEIYRYLFTTSASEDMSDRRNLDENKS